MCAPSQRLLKLFLASSRISSDAKRMAIDVWSGAYTALVERLKKWYPDDAERERFAERVKADLLNPDYHMYSVSYDTFMNMLTEDTRWWDKSPINVRLRVWPNAKL